METQINEERSAEDILSHFNRLLRWNQSDLLDGAEHLLSLVVSLRLAVEKDDFSEAQRLTWGIAQIAPNLVRNASALNVLNSIGDMKEYLA